MIHIWKKAPDGLDIHMPSLTCRVIYVLTPKIKVAKQTSTALKFKVSDLDEPTEEDLKELVYYTNDRPSTPPPGTYRTRKLPGLIACS